MTEPQKVKLRTGVVADKTAVDPVFAEIKRLADKNRSILTNQAD